LVAGAAARDLILVNIHGLRPGCAIRDIDFGIAVETWNRFCAVKGTSGGKRATSHPIGTRYNV